MLLSRIPEFSSKHRDSLSPPTLENGREKTKVWMLKKSMLRGRN